MKPKKIILFVISLFLSQTYAKNLLEIYEEAKKEDSSFKTAYYSLLAAGEKLPQAEAILLPNIGLNATINKQKGEVSFNNDNYLDRDIRNWNVSLQLTQPLFRIQNWLGYQQAKWQIKQAEADFIKIRQELILRVAQAYFDLLITQDEIELLTLQQKGVEHQLESAKNNYKAGNTTITDIYEASSRLELIQANIIATKKAYEDKKATLEQITNSSIEDIARLKENITLSNPLPDTLTQWVQGAMQTNPTVVASEAYLKMAEYELTKNRSGHLPTLDVVASYNQNYASGSISSPADIQTKYKAGQIGLQFSLPIFAGGATNSKVQEATINIQKALSELENSKRSSIFVAKQSFYGVQHSIMQIKYLNEAVINSQNSIEANKIGYKTGVRITTDVLNAEQQLATAKKELTKVKYETLLYGLKLKASNGILCDQDISDITVLLIPN